jgi:hypothetical protein
MDQGHEGEQNVPQEVSQEAPTVTMEVLVKRNSSSILCSYCKGSIFQPISVPHSLLVNGR